jgi:SWIM zinc finger
VNITKTQRSAVNRAIAALYGVDAEWSQHQARYFGLGSFEEIGKQLLREAATIQSGPTGERVRSQILPLMPKFDTTRQILEARKVEQKAKPKASKPRGLAGTREIRENRIYKTYAGEPVLGWVVRDPDTGKAYVHLKPHEAHLAEGFVAKGYIVRTKVRAALYKVPDAPEFTLNSTGMTIQPVVTIQGKTSTYAITLSKPNRETGKSHWYCSCPAWKFQRATPEHRTCKHLEAFYASADYSKGLVSK